LKIAPPAAQAVYEQLKGALPHPIFEQINIKAGRLMSDLGITFDQYGERNSGYIVPFDIFPRVIEADEWSALMRGLIQRVAVWNAFFRDIYDSQEVLKAGIIPFELIYSDPNYLRGSVGVKVPSDIFVHSAAFDLARDEQGGWTVIDDYVSRPMGASYALQVRSVLSQAAPQLFELAPVSPLSGYASELLELLRGCVPSGSAEPRVVALTAREETQAYYEDSFMARQMGIPLVAGSDLVVLYGRVYYKTIDGLEPIDVIYRRTGDSGIDPVAHDNTTGGVPGLMSCVRKGTVAIANAVGTGLGDNRALAAYLPRLARFYLNEPLRLPVIPRLLCIDPDQCQQVLDHLRDYFVATVATVPGQRVWRTTEMNDEEIAALRSQIEENPANFVAEAYAPADTMPTAAGDGRPRHAGLRVFTLGNRALPDYPCALTRVAADPQSRIISTGFGGGIKDTWILRGGTSNPPPVDDTASSRQRRLSLGSRTAESLYWMGRYVERAENTTRIVKVLQSMQTESAALRDDRDWIPLWEALARATGHASSYFKRSTAKQRNVTYYLLLDRSNDTSVISCIEHCRANAQSTRESVAPEVWLALNLAHLLLSERITGPKEFLNETSAEGAIALENAVLNQLDAISGAVQKHMLRDNAWQFWNLGVHLERAVTIALITRQVFLKRQNETAPAQLIDINLDALLRMLSSLYAYRSRFQTRPILRNVATMLLQDAQVPHSLFYCINKIEATLASVFRASAAGAAVVPSRLAEQLKFEINFLDLDPYFIPDTKGETADLGRLLETYETKFNELSSAISDHYLYHQAINILR
jgi:uncharacterized circularly permuted ATP-grasp superfamily protein/uncharacterized alpha-E superfamily protein